VARATLRHVRFSTPGDCSCTLRVESLVDALALGGVATKTARQAVVGSGGLSKTMQVVVA